jgi:histidinol-phosphate aminotransferase
LRLPNVLAVRTFSKAYSLAGLRVGYAVGSAELTRALFKIKDSYNLDAISQRLALAALSDVGHMRRNVRRIRATRERLCKALAARGYEVFPSETNFLWTKPGGIGAGDLFRELRKRGVLIRWWPGRRTGAFVRITIGTDAEVDALLRAIREIQDRV